MTTLRITVTLTRESGLFVGRDELYEAVESAIQDADLSGLGAQGESEYTVESVELESEPVRLRRGVVVVRPVK